MTTFAGTGEAGFADGSADTAKFNYPWGIAINNNTGDLYVSDSHRIRKITRDGNLH